MADVAMPMCQKLMWQYPCGDSRRLGRPAMATPSGTSNNPQ